MPDVVNECCKELNLKRFQILPEQLCFYSNHFSQRSCKIVVFLVFFLSFFVLFFLFLW